MKRKIALDREEIRQAVYEEFCSIGLRDRRVVLSVTAMAEAPRSSAPYKNGLISMNIDMSTTDFERAVDFVLEQAATFLSRDFPDDRTMLFFLARPMTIGDWRRDKDFWKGLENREFVLDPSVNGELRRAPDYLDMEDLCSGALVCYWIIRRKNGEDYLQPLDPVTH